MSPTLLAKCGAEGLHVTANLLTGLGTAVKVIDGALRAVPGAVLAVLEGVGVLDGVSNQTLDALAPTSLGNADGRIVGRIAAHLPTFPDAP